MWNLFLKISFTSDGGYLALAAIPERLEAIGVSSFYSRLIVTILFFSFMFLSFDIDAHALMKRMGEERGYREL